MTNDQLKNKKEPNFPKENSAHVAPKRLIIYTKRAFTVVEMLVVVGIFVMISGVILFNSKSFSSSANLQNVVQDTAMSIRKTQSYAIGAQTPNITSGTVLGFGIHFGDIYSTTWAKKYAIFTDFSTGAVGKYQPNGTSCGVSYLAPGSECLEEILITSGEKISNICMSYNGKSNQMSSAVGSGNACVGSSGDSVSIYFNRPNPDALFCWFKSANANTCVTTISSNTISDISIEITSLNNSKKMITIWNTGQIGVK